VRAGALRTRTTTGYSRPNRGEDLIVLKTTESTFGQRSEVETDKRRFSFLLSLCRDRSVRFKLAASSLNSYRGLIKMQDFVNNAALSLTKEGFYARAAPLPPSSLLPSIDLDSHRLALKLWVKSSRLHSGTGKG